MKKSLNEMPRSIKLLSRGEIFQRQQARDERERLRNLESLRVRAANEVLTREVEALRAYQRLGLVSGRYGSESSQNWFKVSLTKQIGLYQRGPFVDGDEAESFFFTKVHAPKWHRYPMLPSGRAPIHDGSFNGFDFDVKMANRVTATFPIIGSIARFRMSEFQRNELVFIVWAAATRTEVAYYQADWDYE